MQLFGLIDFPPELTVTRWAELIAEYDELSSTDSIQIINPFTEESEQITSAKQMAHVTIGGNIVGALRWSIDDSGIEVYGSSDEMHPIAERLADDLGSSFDTSFKSQHGERENE